MTAFLIGMLASIVTGALVNELCDLSPWLAQKLVAWAARRWDAGNAELSEIYAEEWAAVIEDCPGKLTKLAHATRFALSAAFKARQQRKESWPVEHGRLQTWVDAAGTLGPASAGPLIVAEAIRDSNWAGMVIGIGMTALGALLMAVMLSPARRASRD